MSDMNIDILNKLIVGRVEPYIYAFSTQDVRNYLKVGDTYRSVEKRLDEWRKYFLDLEKQFSCVAKVDDKTYFRDYAIHSFLERKKGKDRLERGSIEGISYYSNEFFRDTKVEDIKEAIADIKNSHAQNDGRYKFYRFEDSRIPIDYKWERNEDYKPRPNQKDAIEKFKIAIDEGRTNLLMYAVMRFGKSFTSMCCATEMDAKFVVIVSAKADVRGEWKKTVESHTRFEGYTFIDSRSNVSITQTLKKGGKIAIFLTLQDLQGEEIKQQHKEVFTNKIDLLLIDETHFGARGNEYGRVLADVGVITKAQQKKELSQSDETLEELNDTIKVLNPKVRIHLSGTPYRILMGSEFTKDDIIAFCQFTDIIDEQEKWDQQYVIGDVYEEDSDDHKKGEPIKEWDNPYYGFPQMVRFAFKPNQSSIKKMEELKKQGVTYALSALLKPASITKDATSSSHKKFVHEQEVLELLEVIDGSKSDENLLGFLDYDKIKDGNMCRHIVCVLPFRASCDALECLIKSNKKRFKNLSSYEIINIAGVDDERTYKKTEEVKDQIKKCESQGKKTLTLTVNRMLTGSTVEEWDTMLYLKDTASPQEYDQAIFRLQNQYVKTYKDATGDTIKYNMKPQTLLVDFDPHRLFRMQEQKSQIYNANVEDNGNDKLEERIKRELEVSPVVVLNHNKIQQVTPEDILKAVSEYSSSRSVADEASVIPVDFSLLNDTEIKDEIEKQAEMNSREGLTIEANKAEGEGDELDTPESASGTEDAGNSDATEEPKAIKDEEIESIRKKFATYYSRLLFFAFLTNSKVSSVKDVISAIDGDNENKRIAKSLEIKRNILALFRQKMNPFILSKLDYKIQNLNTLANDTSLQPLDRATTALNKFGRLSDSEVVTPSKVADEMVALLPDKDINDGTKILDIAAKQGEFAVALYKRFGDKVKDNIYSVTTSTVTYEFTRKIYDILKMPIENIFVDFTSYDIIGIDAEKRIKELSDMKFDVIIGNPPYQESDGGGRESSAISLYHKFVESAKMMNPKYMSMIIPARWYAGGKGLAGFRKEMLQDSKLSQIHDFPETSDCFSSLNIRGGVCYFLRDTSHTGNCKITNYKGGVSISSRERPIRESGCDIFIRYNDAISILRKVQQHREDTFSSIVSSRNPFQIPSNFNKYKTEKDDIYKIKLYRFGEDGYVCEEQVSRNNDLIAKWKVIDSKASPGGDEYPHQILTRPIISEPNSVCTETYLIIKTAKSKVEAQNIVSYIHTRFFRFMVSLIKNTQNISKGVYAFVPVQDFSKPWTDSELYAKYNLTKKEIAFIESMIKPME